MLALIWVRVGPYMSSPDSAALFWPLGESAGKGRGQLGGHWRPLSPPGSAVEFQGLQRPSLLLLVFYGSLSKNPLQRNAYVTHLLSLLFSSQQSFQV